MDGKCVPRLRLALCVSEPLARYLEKFPGCDFCRLFIHIHNLDSQARTILAGFYSRA